MWIFGYGSLMWNPGFQAIRCEKAILHGYHRALCRYSFHHRGTREAPGLVMGLEPGGSCVGMALQMAESEATAAFQQLDQREGDGYQRIQQPLLLEKGVSPRFVEGWVYLPNPQHDSYFGEQTNALEIQRLAQIMAVAKGKSGSSYDYMAALLAHLEQINIEEDVFQQIFEQANTLRIQSRQAKA